VECFQREGGRLTHESELRIKVSVAVVELDVVHPVNAGEEGEWELGQ
jgi:hypothetical protein